MAQKEQLRSETLYPFEPSLRLLAPIYSPIETQRQRMRHMARMAFGRNGNSEYFSPAPNVNYQGMYSGRQTAVSTRPTSIRLRNLSCGVITTFPASLERRDRVRCLGTKRYHCTIPCIIPAGFEMRLPTSLTTQLRNRKGNRVLGL